jgi:DNA-binding transcriptional MerR regulator
MAELSRSSGVPVATIKYYLREGLLPPGTATSATRAEYGQAHLRRLRLIRALLEIGEVPVAAIGKILAVVDNESASAHAMLGAVQYELGPHPARVGTAGRDREAARREADELIADLGWTVAPDAPARTLLIATLAALRRTEAARPGPGLRAYADAVAGLAAAEVAGLAAQDSGRPKAPGASRVALAESAVVGMVLHERILIALHRLAQEDASSRHFGQPLRSDQQLCRDQHDLDAWRRHALLMADAVSRRSRRRYR